MDVIPGANTGEMDLVHPKFSTYPPNLKFSMYVVHAMPKQQVQYNYRKILCGWRGPGLSRPEKCLLFLWVLLYDI